MIEATTAPEGRQRPKIMRGEGDVAESRGVADLELTLGRHEGDATQTRDGATEDRR